MNGLTAKKMQKIFESLAPETIRSDARNFVEYCCFRYLSRDNSGVHPSLKVCECIPIVSMIYCDHIMMGKSEH